jgi:hypothetical protein
MKNLAPFPALDIFLFNTPLYTQYQLNDDLIDVRSLCGRVKSSQGEFGKAIVDGFCPHCKRDSTFKVEGISIVSGTSWENIKRRHAHDEFAITCSRDANHKIQYFVELRHLKIRKIGQLPSVADIAIDEARQKYSAVLKDENWSEFYKAIGLAAHGEGIGSFVYLRRVFERLIFSRFMEHKQEKTWDESEFTRLRMDEKIAFLKDFLPNYLVSAKKLYSIFSLGIHELDNNQCLSFFDVGKRSIIVVLEEDLRMRKDQEERKKLTEAIAKFENNPKGETNND